MTFDDNKNYFSNIVPRDKWEDLMQQLLADQSTLRIFTGDHTSASREFLMAKYFNEKARVILSTNNNDIEFSSPIQGFSGRDIHYRIKWGSLEYTGTGKITIDSLKNVIFFDLKDDLLQRQKRTFSRLCANRHTVMKLEQEIGSYPLFDLSGGGFSIKVPKNISARYKKRQDFLNSKIYLADECFYIKTSSVIAISNQGQLLIITFKFLDMTIQDQQKLMKAINKELDRVAYLNHQEEEIRREKRKKVFSILGPVLLIILTLIVILKLIKLF